MRDWLCRRTHPVCCRAGSSLRIRNLAVAAQLPPLPKPVGRPLCGPGSIHPPLFSPRYGMRIRARDDVRGENSWFYYTTEKHSFTSLVAGNAQMELMYRSVLFRRTKNQPTRLCKLLSAPVAFWFNSHTTTRFQYHPSGQVSAPLVPRH